MYSGKVQNFTGATPRQNFENIGPGRGSPGKGLSSAGLALIKVKIPKLRRDLVFLSPDIAFKSSKVPGDPRSKRNFCRGAVLKGVLFAGWPPARPSAVPGPGGHPRGIGRGCPALSRLHHQWDSTIATKRILAEEIWFSGFQACQGSLLQNGGKDAWTCGGTNA